MSGLITCEEATAAGPWELCIIGGGPASLAAAVKLSSWKRSTIIIGAGHSRTGMIQWSVNHPAMEGITGPRLLGKARLQASNFGARFLGGAVTNLARTRQSDGELGMFEVSVTPGLYTLDKPESDNQSLNDPTPVPESAVPQRYGACVAPTCKQMLLQARCVMLCTGVEDAVLCVPGLGQDALAAGHIRIGPMSDGVTDLFQVAVLSPDTDCAGDRDREYAVDLACTLAQFAQGVTLYTGSFLGPTDPATVTGLPSTPSAQVSVPCEQWDTLKGISDDQSRALTAARVRVVQDPITLVAMQASDGSLWCAQEGEKGVLRQLSQPLTGLTGHVYVACEDKSCLPTDPDELNDLLGASVTFTREQFEEGMGWQQGACEEEVNEGMSATRSSPGPVPAMNAIDAHRHVFSSAFNWESGTELRGTGPIITRYQIVVKGREGDKLRTMTVHELYSGLRPKPRGQLALSAACSVEAPSPLSPGGHIVADAMGRVQGMPGLFAAGDAVEGLAEMGVAMGQGSLAAMAVQRFLCQRR